MRILHLANHVRCVGNGIVNMMTDLACYQGDSGNTVAVASSGGDYVDLLAAHSVKHITLKQHPLPKASVPGMFWRMQRLNWEFQPDIVHAHMVTGMLTAKLLKPFSKYKLVSTVHNEFDPSSKWMGWADAVVGVSAFVTEAMRQRGVKRSVLHTVYNGTIGSPRQIRSGSVRSLEGRPRIVTVAGMYKRKGIDVLIKAFAQVLPEFPEARLFIVGEGPDRKEFEQLAKEMAIAHHISFEGFQQDVFVYLRAADIFVLASRREPLGLVLLEAREAGCAIVACAVDGIPEALEQGKTGILVPPGDAGQLAKALKELMQDDAYRASMAEKAHANLEWMTVKRMGREYEEIYRSLL